MLNLQMKLYGVKLHQTRFVQSFCILENYFKTSFEKKLMNDYIVYRFLLKIISQRSALLFISTKGFSLTQ